METWNLEKHGTTRVREQIVAELQHLERTGWKMWLDDFDWYWTGWYKGTLQFDPKVYDHETLESFLSSEVPESEILLDPIQREYFLALRIPPKRAMG